MKLLLLREFREGWRSFRFPGLLLMAAFFALLEPPSQKYMDVLLSKFADGVQIILPPPTPEAAYIAFAGDMFSLVLIAAVVVTMGIVARENHSGLTEWFLTRPVSRSAYILAKAVYLIVSTFAFVAVASLICALYTQTILGPLKITGVLLATVLITTQLLMPLMLTLSVSAITGIAGAAAGAGLFFMFTMSTLGWLLGNTDYSWLPFTLNSHLPRLLAGTIPAAFLTGLALAWLLIACLVLLTRHIFLRKQI